MFYSERLVFFQENIRIKVCNLSWNGFGSRGGSAMADALAQNEALTELDVSGNRIDSFSAELIVKGSLIIRELMQLSKKENLIRGNFYIQITFATNQNHTLFGYFH